MNLLELQSLRRCNSKSAFEAQWFDHKSKKLTIAKLTQCRRSSTSLGRVFFDPIRISIIHQSLSRMSLNGYETALVGFEPHGELLSSLYRQATVLIRFHAGYQRPYNCAIVSKMESLPNNRIYYMFCGSLRCSGILGSITERGNRPWRVLDANSSGSCHHITICKICAQGSDEGENSVEDRASSD